MVQHVCVRVAPVECMLLEVRCATSPACGRLAHDKPALFPDGRRNLDSVLGLGVSLSYRRRYVAVSVCLTEHVIRPRARWVRRVALRIWKAKRCGPGLAPDREDTTNEFTARPVRPVDDSYDGVDELTCQYVMHLAADLKIEWDHRRTNVELICLVGHVAITAWAGTYECHTIAIFRNAEHLWREGESG
jgi:hypothetical protein